MSVPTINEYIQESINYKILESGFEAFLPIVEPWVYEIMEGPQIPRDTSRTEGDGLFLEQISELTSTIEDDPTRCVRYSVQHSMMRAALTSNETFRYLMFSIGLYEEDPATDDKYPGDVLELYLRALDRHATDTERRIVVQWVVAIFGPLLDVALDAHSSYNHFVGQSSRKRKSLGEADENDGDSGVNFNAYTRNQMYSLFDHIARLQVYMQCSSLSPIRHSEALLLAATCRIANHSVPGTNDGEGRGHAVVSKCTLGPGYAERRGQPIRMRMAKAGWRQKLGCSSGAKIEEAPVGLKDEDGRKRQAAKRAMWSTVHKSFIRSLGPNKRDTSGQFQNLRRDIQSPSLRTR
ncbi:hypothetical protein DFH06DRAFT_1154425 [Mycena polygramma]|nr:hypothetical protein DFH06DRAFT_1154425 [Mycena polygramma]